ncbi:PP2C family serine/threonine-protein phosphatase [Rhodovulum sp. P5]|uniref:PP2C family protein-serine/threonine phosphatase n=1 Tax=Rhodovulum sp. P5 TaxID=1564506 RepID=UPI0020A37A06|nr:protein phosphatase 2C domain-containing protein [Rhodovulum sp. P5]
MTIFRHSAVTHTGRVRKINEDSILSLPDHRIWVVSDGMGGHEAGDFASQTVTAAVAALPPDMGPKEMMRALRGAIHDAHAQILAESERSARGVIGATVVALILTDDHFAAFWAGDSRLYCLRDGELDMLTHDHSVLADLVLSGAMTWEEAERHPESNVITRAVGVGDPLELDKIRGDVRPGDRFLLCSDGLTKHLGLADLAAVLRAEPMETVAEKLVSRALEGGGTDNISAIVVDVV